MTKERALEMHDEAWAAWRKTGEAYRAIRRKGGVPSFKIAQRLLDRSRDVERAQYRLVDFD